ncbi:helix-turn-helix transcriptional regulator [Anabaena sp. WFMT]|uniref:helix-turn-helix transcriptional regulator n=1 Tax=Anabaena sp. WFMT TaxID=3449730 RepID=UPI003F25EF0B
MNKATQNTEQKHGGESPLKQLRDELDMSQEDFGRTIGISVRTVSRWEAGVNVPSFTIPQLKSLDRLLRSHGKSIQDLPDSFAPIPQALITE